MPKFKIDDPVAFRLGQGKVTHVWPPELLNGAEQHYFIERDLVTGGGTYDVNESEMTLVVPEPPLVEPAPAEFPPPEPDQVGDHESGDLRTNPDTRGLVREGEAVGA